MKVFALFALTFVSAVHIASDPVSEHLLPPKKVDAVAPPPYKASDDGMPGYTRTVPENFNTDSDDQFMRSVIGKYAVETRDKEGKPTGQFYLDKSGAKALADEVVGTHSGKKGAAAADHIASTFDSAWTHSDVNGEGKIEAARAAPLMRSILGNQQADLHLSVKK